MTKKPWGALAHPMVVALAVLIIGWPVSAHEAKPPTDDYTRVLHDHNDDCGGDGVTARCGGTHDLIALDVREAWQGQWGDVLVFRFVMDEGDGGVRRDILTFRVEDEVHVFDLREGAEGFSGSFDHVGPKRPIGDGSRFEVEAVVALDRMNATLGSRLTDFRLQATLDGAVGDRMPGGYTNAEGSVEDPPQGERQTNFRLASLTLKGPVQYGSIHLDPQGATLPADSETLVWVHVENLLDDLSETFHLTASAGQDVTARFHDPATGGSGYSDQYNLSLEPGRSGIVHLAVEPAAEGGEGGPLSGTIVVTMTSERGGRVQETFTYGPSPDGPDPAEDVPTAGPAAAMLSLICLAWVARRRWQQ